MECKIVEGDLTMTGVRGGERRNATLGKGKSCGQHLMNEIRCPAPANFAITSGIWS